jgi:hypothetical protein
VGVFIFWGVVLFAPLVAFMWIGCCPCLGLDECVGHVPCGCIGINCVHRIACR